MHRIQSLGPIWLSVILFIQLFVSPPGYAQETLGEALDQPFWNWTTQGSPFGWYVYPDASSYGGSCAKAAGIPYAQGFSTYLQTTLNGPGLLAFRYRSDSQMGAPPTLTYSFQVDGQPPTYLPSYSPFYQVYSTSLSVGPHALTWVAAGNDLSSVQLDGVTFNPAPTITTSSPLPSGTVGVSYSQALVASGGIGPYSWSVFSGAVPAGLNLSPGGVISGAPTLATNSTFTAQVSGMDGATSTKQFNLVVGAAATGRIEILSLAANGRLTFTNSLTNGLFTVQWAPSLPTTNWSDNWEALRNFMPTASVTTVSVPMFYRVTCLTNQFFPTPVGLQFLYAASNSWGTTGTLQITSVGSLKLTSGKEYSILEMLDSRDCALRLLSGRSTENEYYTIPWDISQTEKVEFRRGLPGTTWTNEWCDGSSDQVTIAANETITVPAGVFDCLKIEQREINDNLRLQYVYWIKPGFGMVRHVNYGDETAPQDVWELSSWVYRPPF